jgi:hypothetical protein
MNSDAADDPDPRRILMDGKRRPQDRIFELETTMKKNGNENDQTSLFPWYR